MRLDKMVTTKGSERTELLLRFLVERLPDMSITVDPDKCEEWNVPGQWRELLLAQSNSVAIPWDLIWKPAEQWFPEVRRLVVQKCLGVAVSTKDGSAPTLIYVFCSSEGLGYCYLGYHPLQASKLVEYKEVQLPAAYKNYYAMVHNGFQESRSLSGLMGFRRRTMEDIVSEADAFDGESPLYKLANLVPMYSSAGGDFICIDVERSSTLDVIGGRYKHEEPMESVFDSDVKELVGQAFSYVSEDLVDRQD